MVSENKTLMKRKLEACSLYQTSKEELETIYFNRLIELFQDVLVDNFKAYKKALLKLKSIKEKNNASHKEMIDALHEVKSCEAFIKSERFKLMSSQVYSPEEVMWTIKKKVGFYD